ncbi:hypothetical protein [Melittangium boletus]|uniref:hypothetical protein n=1 Tax=Melittangium boletus TaxID=83453 RepID=UPI003DA38AF3
MKNGLVMHVHGVASPEEAEQLELLGVDLVGVVVGGRKAGRVMGGDDASAIASRLRQARLCVESLNGTPSLDARAAKRMGAQVVHVPWGTEVSRAWRESLAQEGLEWALVRVAADEDDDPAWVRGRLEELGAPPPTWAQMEICPSLEDGWRILRESNEDALDARDLDALAAESPILFSLPLSFDKIREVRRGLSRARGFSFALGDRLGKAPGAHHFTLEQIRALLKQFDAEVD